MRDVGPIPRNPELGIAVEFKIIPYRVLLFSNYLPYFFQDWANSRKSGIRNCCGVQNYSLSGFILFELFTVFFFPGLGRLGNICRNSRESTENEG